MTFRNTYQLHFIDIVDQLFNGPYIYPQTAAFGFTVHRKVNPIAILKLLRLIVALKCLRPTYMPKLRLTVAFKLRLAAIFKPKLTFILKSLLIFVDLVLV